MIGKWQGFYKHTSKSIPKEYRNKFIIFNIEIKEQTDKHFYGTVCDEEQNGGMQGEGIIEGQLNDSQITFVKKMPTETILMPDGKIKVTKRKHKDIIYQGEFDEAEQQYKGTWKIKLGISWIGILPILVGSNKGVWQMKKQK